MERPCRRTRPVRPATRLALAVGAIVVWGGCSVEKNYEVLSFLFDGVPDPSEAAEDGPGGRARRSGAAVNLAAVSSHSAYIERRCADCHGAGARFGLRTEGFTDMNESVCLKCHADAIQSLAVVHGPLEAGACLVCHEAHVSSLPRLLRTASPALCLDCHDPESQGGFSSPVHDDLTRDCLDCHYGHGGADPYFLRPMTPVEAPGASEAGG